MNKRQAKFITAEQFKQQAELKNIIHWPIHDCSMCGYKCKFVFKNENVFYDAGCYCVHGDLQDRSWEDVEDHYNRQKHPDVIKRMNEFWGFSE